MDEKGFAFVEFKEAGNDEDRDDDTEVPSGKK